MIGTSSRSVSRRAVLGAAGLSTALVGLSLAAACAPWNQGSQPTAVRRIGWLDEADLSSDPAVGWFRQEFAKLGWVEGRTYSLEIRSAMFKAEQAPVLAAELVRLGVDIIVSRFIAPTRAARQATNTIPIVMVGGPPDPVGDGLVASLARPGGNLTGLTPGPLDVWTVKRLELFKQAVPVLAHVAILWDVDAYGADVEGRPFQRAFVIAAGELGIRVRRLEVRGPDELDGAFAIAVADGFDGVFVIGSPMFAAQRRRIADLALRYRLPSSAPDPTEAEPGFVLTYAPDLRHLWQRAAIFVDRILKGARPGDLPIEEPTQFSTVISLRTARALGLAIPSSVLAQVTEVIQ